MVLAGLLALLFNLAVLRSNQQTVEIAVAAADLRAGATLIQQQIVVREVPADEVLTARMLLADDAAVGVGRILIRPVERGAPILLSDLRSADDNDGRRAMSVPIEQSRSVAGGLSVGDRVDVILVVDGIAAFVATDLEVIDIPTGDGNALGVGSGYAPTLAVTDIDSLRIAAALDAGVVHLIRATGAAAVSVDMLPAIEPVPNAEASP